MRCAKPRRRPARTADGSSIFSTSVIGTKLETYGAYAATKAAVEMLTAILSKELPRAAASPSTRVAPGADRDRSVS